jgi:hypothetical protein
MTKTCGHCARSFQAKKTLAKFCSRGCSSASRGKAWLCERCGKPARKRGLRFCSRQCAADARKRPVLERIQRLSKTTPEGCWEWQGTAPGGYGRMYINNRNVSVHRTSYELFVGPIAADMTIDHLCLNKRCWNPEHLEQVTFAENARRARASYRTVLVRLERENAELRAEVARLRLLAILPDEVAA